MSAPGEPERCDATSRVPEATALSLMAMRGHDVVGVVVHCQRPAGHPPNGHSGQLLNIGDFIWESPY